VSPASSFTGLLVLWLAAAIAYQIASQVALARFLGRRRNPVRPLPTCTILRPLRGANSQTEANLDRLLAIGAPVVIGVEDTGDAAVDAARRAAERHPTTRMTLCIGPAPDGLNRKVANLSRMLKEARGEIVIVTDGDVATPHGYLESVLAPFEDPDVGLATCPYRSVGGTSLAERVDVLLTNTGFLPSVAVAERLEGARFALGATIAVRRTILDAVGGFAPLADLLADDHALAARVIEAGHRTVLVPLLLDHHVDRAGIGDVWRRHIRWARTMRSVRPGGYAGTLVTHGLAPASALATIGGAAGIGAALMWLLVRTGGVFILRRQLKLKPRDLLLLPAADLLALALYFGGFMGRTVHWGGARLSISRKGRIRSSRIAAPHSAARFESAGRPEGVPNPAIDEPFGTGPT